MRWYTFVISGLLTASLLAGVVGCPYTPRSTEESKGGKKLTLKGPADASLKPGETVTINVDITRDKFNDPVELKFTGLPEGVTMVENDRTISKDASSSKLTLQAAADAKAVDDHKVTVTASGGGMTQEATFKVTVKKKT